MAELPAGLTATDGEQPRGLEMPGQQRVYRLAYEGRRARDADRRARINPAGTPRDVVARLNREINAILAAPDMRQKLADQGAEAVGGTPEAFAVNG